MTAPDPASLVEPVALARIGTQTQKIVIEADADARAALAERFGLLELPAFRAEATLRRRRDTGWIELKGSLRAEVVQECVATLEPVAGPVAAEIDELFDDSRAAEGVEVDIDPVAEDPEPLDGETLDVGEVIAQVLSLAIDPYPRAPGAESAGPDANAGSPGAEDAEDTGGSPFAALALLKDRNVKNR